MEAVAHIRDLHWRWLTQAKATAEPEGFVLKQADESFYLRATASSPLTFAFEDVAQPRNKFDSENPGLSRLIIRLKTPAHSDGWISVTGASGSPRQIPHSDMKPLQSLP